MRKRFGLRMFLPIIQLCLFVSLLIRGWDERPELSQGWAASDQEAELNQGWNRWVHTPYSAPFVWAYGINLPPVLLSVVMLVPLGPVAILSEGAVRGYVWLILCGGLVALWWYWIGYRLDQAFGFLPPRQGASASGSRRLLIGLCILGVCSIALYSRWWDEYLIEMKLPMLIWAVCGIWALCRRYSSLR